MESHYIPDIYSLFKDVNRILKKDGIFFAFSTHHPFVDFRDSASGDYFSCEQLTQTWQTIGKPVDVSFYRRSLTSIFKAVTDAGFSVISLSEGNSSDDLKAISKPHYIKLKTKPQFLFLKCRKI